MLISGFTGLTLSVVTMYTFGLVPMAVTAILAVLALSLAFYADYRKAY